MRKRAQAGVTLMEVLIAVSLLSLLSVGILFALRVGLSAMSKANTRLMDNRRVAGAQKILQQQLAGFIPLIALCSPAQREPGIRVPFFQGEPQSLRIVSTYSLEGASRGFSQILEFQVTPGEEGKGVRLVVNEIPYTGPLSAGSLCLGLAADPALGAQSLRFKPIEVGPGSFVLADRLAYCRFSYLMAAPPPALEAWRPNWYLPRWPIAVRMEMAPLEPNPSRLNPVTVTAPLHVNRDPAARYTDGDI